jgi:hypothetical protein
VSCAVTGAARSAARIDGAETGERGSGRPPRGKPRTRDLEHAVHTIVGRAAKADERWTRRIAVDNADNTIDVYFDPANCRGAHFGNIVKLTGA